LAFFLEKKKPKPKPPDRRLVLFGLFRSITPFPQKSLLRPRKFFLQFEPAQPS
jgi:hypothetical protein